MGDEPLWITQDVRTTATPCRGVTAARLALARGGMPGTGVGELRIPVAHSWAAGRRPGLGPQARPGGPAQGDRPTMHPMAATIATGGHRLWLSQRALDPEADRRGDAGGVWRPLPPFPCLEAPPLPGLELSGAGPAAHPTRRAGHGAWA